MSGLPDGKYTIKSGFSALPGGASRVDYKTEVVIEGGEIKSTRSDVDVPIDLNDARRFVEGYSEKGHLEHNIVDFTPSVESEGCLSLFRRFER